jgi:SAM-dependent MidA family methyltransferase
MAALAERIRSEIGDGSMSFADFMARCLYDPADGFYAQPAVTGRAGHFYTSVSVGPVFGGLLGRFVLGEWERMGCPAGLDLMEQGANDGRLMADVLAWCEREAPGLASALRVTLVEPLEALRARQRDTLAAWAGRVRWVDSPAQLAGAEGVFFSNELVDALPVHRVAHRAGAWWECRVVRGEPFGWREEPVTSGLADEIARWGIPAVEGYTTEVCPAAADWMRSVGRALRRGTVLTIDYGHEAEVLYTPSRAEGTLTAYCRHEKNYEFLSDPGEQDLTAHVNFTQLREAGEAEGLTVREFTDQHHFLVRLAAVELKEMESGVRPDAEKWLRGFKTLMHPELMGTTFRVLVQEKRVA